MLSISNDTDEWDDRDGAAALPNHTFEKSYWSCEACTLFNLEEEQKCTLCFQSKPNYEKINEDILCDELNKAMIQNDTTILSANNTKQYSQLLDLESDDIVPNWEPFECDICLMQTDVGQGAILRDCLHTFCKDCLSHTIEYSTDAEVKCPYADARYSCESVLQDREIKALVTKKVYELHLAKSVTLAEQNMENTFHCKTPNCTGWCIYEYSVNLFECPVCKFTNCLTCRGIHQGLTCKQYQDLLDINCESNTEAKRTKELLTEMLRNGEAMNCPKCNVIITKKDGCDGIICSMCKTDICWVTRGLRWGPSGKGDTTGGCRCKVNGIRCHPSCNNCH